MGKEGTGEKRGQGGGREVNRWEKRGQGGV